MMMLFVLAWLKETFNFWSSKVWISSHCYFDEKYLMYDQPFSIFVIYKIICLQELSSKEDLNMQVALDLTEDEINNLQIIVQTESR